MDCPMCHLINPPEAVACDCGYNFVTNRVLGVGALRKEKVLILPQGASLPPNCIRCGRPVNGRYFRKRYYWYNPRVNLFRYPIL